MRIDKKRKNDMRKLDESSVNETKWDKGREQKRPNEK